MNKGDSNFSLHPVQNHLVYQTSHHSAIGVSRQYNSDLDSYWLYVVVLVCVEVLRPSQPNGVMSSAVNLPNHTFTEQA